MKIEQIPPDVKPDIQITMTWDEALTFAVVCRSIGGDGARTRRGHFETFNEGLPLEMRKQAIDMMERTKKVTEGSISFKEGL